jgi:CubicO group peptidase (beta-lactamase class C family)
MHFTPGTKMLYSNDGIQILGGVAEIVSGKSFDRLFNESIKSKLLMNSTIFTSNIGETAYYNNPSNSLDINRFVGGGAMTTIPDYSNFLFMLLNGG